MAREFQYQPLDTASQEIRILSITKSRNVKVEFHINHVPWKGDATYEALSYTWGDRSKTCSITLNGLPFVVTENLAIALQILAEVRSPVHLWVDAICINQQDNTERNAQVSRMKQIYESAKNVIIWLGDEANDSSYAMSVMNNIDRRWSNQNSHPSNLHGIATPVWNERALLAIAQFFRRTWWQRVWIIQEATCPSDTYIRCGKDCIEFSAAVATVNILAQDTVQKVFRQDFAYVDIRNFYRVISLDQLRRTRKRPGQRSDLLSLLDNSRINEASDPRDKIFALSGLATDTQREAGKPNYDLPVDEVYIQFACALINSEKTLNVLGHCQESTRTPQSWSRFKFLRTPLIPKRCLPSWVPDWTLMLEATPFTKSGTPGIASSITVYKASDNYFPTVRLAEDRRTLFVRGAEIDTVSQLSQAFGSQPSQSNIRIWHSWAQRELGSTYHKNETTHDAFLHTLVADVGTVNGRYLRGSAASWPIDNEVAVEPLSLLVAPYHTLLTLEAFLFQKRVIWAWLVTMCKRGTKSAYFMVVRCYSFYVKMVAIMNLKLNAICTALWMDKL